MTNSALNLNFKKDNVFKWLPSNLPPPKSEKMQFKEIKISRSQLCSESRVIPISNKYLVGSKNSILIKKIME